MPYTSSSNRAPTIMITWQHRLAEAYDTEQVLWVVRDFIASWHPEELSALPAGCRPERMADADDVALYAFRLAQRTCCADGDGPALQRMSTFFSAASHRVSQLMALSRHGAPNYVPR